MGATKKNRPFHIAKEKENGKKYKIKELKIFSIVERNVRISQLGRGDDAQLMNDNTQCV